LRRLKPDPLNLSVNTGVGNVINHYDLRSPVLVSAFLIEYFAGGLFELRR